LLKDGGLLDCVLKNPTYNEPSGETIYSVEINKITWEGHQFLDNIRDNDSWKKAKEKR